MSLFDQLLIGGSTHRRHPVGSQDGPLPKGERPGIPAGSSTFDRLRCDQPLIQFFQICEGCPNVNLIQMIVQSFQLVERLDLHKPTHRGRNTERPLGRDLTDRENFLIQRDLIGISAFLMSHPRGRKHQPRGLFDLTLPREQVSKALMRVGKNGHPTPLDPLPNPLHGCEITLNELLKLRQVSASPVSLIRKLTLNHLTCRD